MHPNPAFRTAETAQNLAFARNRAFGVLAVNGAEAAPLISHVPFLLDDDGRTADLHLVRSNPIARLKAEVPAVIAIAGPDSYVSPDWYAVPDQVPTWNYVAVHLRGILQPLAADAMHDMLDRQSAFFENRLLPKTPWKTDKMTPAVLEKMMRQILPFRLRIDAVEGTWKLNQNKPDDVRLRAADAVEAGGIGTGLGPLAQHMRDA
ncbi:MAG: FMN-binding negative transcriptional regulator [Pseudomonadota bacterium]